MVDDSNVTAPPHYAGDGTIECRRAQLSMESGYDRADAMTDRNEHD